MRGGVTGHILNSTTLSVRQRELLLMRIGVLCELYRDDVISAETWAVLAKAFDTKQMLDLLIAVGGYRAVSMAINSAGVQLDANMADFRFPPSLR